MEDVEERISAVQRDHEHGATFLTMEAVGILVDAASACPGGDMWAPCINRVAKRLAEAKPAMASLRNATDRLLRRLVELDPEEGRRQAQTLSRKLLADLRDSAQSAATNAAGLLPSNATIATCSYSSAIIHTCQKALDEGRITTALVFEPLAEADAPGRRMAGELADLGLSTEVVTGPVGHDVIGRAHMVLVGADAVSPTVVVNGTPSLALAQAARGRVPFYVVCETVKLAREAKADVGYDLVPLNLVTAIATEKAVLTPSEVERLKE